MVSMVLGQGTGPTGRPGLGTRRWLGTSTGHGLRACPRAPGRHGHANTVPPALPHALGSEEPSWSWVLAGCPAHDRRGTRMGRLVQPERHSWTSCPVLISQPPGARRGSKPSLPPPCPLAPLPIW